MKRRSCVLTLVLSAALCFGATAFAEEGELTIEQEAVELEAPAEDVAVDFSDELADIYIAEVGEHEEGSGSDIFHMAADPESGHAISNPRVVKQPTCTERGIIRYDCEDVTTHFHEFYIPALGHNWSSESGEFDWGRVIVEPSCTEPGAAEDYCLDCDAVNPDIQPRVIDPLGHDFTEKVVDRVANCKEPELYHYVCTRCGESQGITYEGEIDPNNHAWDKWVTELAPTCCEDGIKVRWCTRCGDKQEKPIPATGPEWVIKSKTLLDCYHVEIEYECAQCAEDCGCEDCDSVTCHGKNTVVKDVVSHVFKYLPAIVKDEAGNLIVDPNYPEDAPNYMEDFKAPTCEEAGYVTYKCIYCDEVETERHAEDVTAHRTIVLDPLGHDWSAWELRHDVDENGSGNKTAYWFRQCERCLKTEEKISAEAPKDDFPPKDGLVLDADGVWRYYSNDIFRSDYTGLVEYDGAEFYVTNGIMETDVNGLTLNAADNKWYFLAAGQVKREFSGITNYDGAFFKIQNGELDTSATGLYTYDGEKFLFADGRFLGTANGLWQDFDGTWYFLSLGRVCKEYYGVALYDGQFFVVEAGKLAINYNDFAFQYDGSTFKVVSGQLYAL